MVVTDIRTLPFWLEAMSLRSSCICSWVEALSGKRRLFLPNRSYEVAIEIGVQVCPPSMVFSRKEEPLP